jgi:hypothetical protein
VFGSDLSFGGGVLGGGGAARARAMLARGQELVDTPRPEGGHPLEWHVMAMLVGDLPALAAMRARASRPDSGPAAVSGR